MRIFFVRHGETVWNREGRLQGQADSPLTLRGVQLSLAYGDFLKGALAATSPDRVGLFMSPLGRTRQTASLLADALGLPLASFAVDPLLAEHDVGVLEGLDWQEIEARHGLTRDAWRRWETRAPGGESRLDVLRRAERWLGEARPHDVAVLVSHGGVSRAFRTACLRLDEAERRGLERHEHGRIFEIEGARCTPHEVVPPEPGPDSPLG
jgi:probable phosphoglycerate mutase